MTGQVEQREVCIKKAMFPAWDHSTPTSRRRCINTDYSAPTPRRTRQLGTSRRTHQDRRYNARLPGHVASWTGHTTSNPGHPAAAYQHQSQPSQLHRGLPANQPSDQRFIIARGLPEASSRHGNAPLLLSWHNSTADDKITASKLRPHLSDCTTTFDINKYLYMCVVL